MVYCVYYIVIKFYVNNLRKKERKESEEKKKRDKLEVNDLTCLYKWVQEKQCGLSAKGLQLHSSSIKARDERMNLILRTGHKAHKDGKHLAAMI